METKVFEEKESANTVIAFLTELAESGNYVFRGYTKQDELYPNLIREGIHYDENKLLTELERYGSRYFQTNSPIEFMSYAQHFGLPTRLLDFTHNPFIALSFSLYTQKSGKYKVNEDKYYYYIRYADVTENIMVNTVPLERLLYFRSLDQNSISAKAIETIGRIEKLMNNPDEHSASDLRQFSVNSLTEEEILERINNKSILFIDPNQSNERIVMQQGLFMVPYTIDKTSHISILEKNTNIIKIHKSLRKSLISYIDILGFNTYRLMPDLASICSAIKKNNIER